LAQQNIPSKYKTITFVGDKRRSNPIDGGNGSEGVWRMIAGDGRETEEEKGTENKPNPFPRFLDTFISPISPPCLDAVFRFR
jgi:hypothetical protein